MKKLLITFALLVSLVSASFAENFFAHRFFEIKLDVPVNISNNLFGITDLLQKQVVIDLAEIADNLPENGASLKADVAPSLSIGIDIPKGLILGLDIGADAAASVGLSKDIFDLIGNGNQGKSSNFTQKTTNTYFDLFAHTSITGGWNTKNSKIKVTGSLFWALAHFDASDTYVKFYSQDNKSGIEANLDARLYSPVDYSKDVSDVQAILSSMKNNGGFDIAAEYQRDLFRFLTVGGKVQIPLKPSTLDMCSMVTTDYAYDFDFEQMFSGEDEGTQNSGSSESSTNAGDSEENLIQEAVKLASPYKIHRPLKLGASVDFHPFGTLLSTSGYLGVGVRHPFAENKAETQFYFDYSVAGRLSLWNVLSFEASHSRIDETFKNEFALALNIRLIEVDAGVSFQSASFAKSFTGAGAGAFVTVCLGF